ncbi:SGNH/GDSL hydrolase family protein [Niabella sp. CC-SYL272]|uniref:SGNH/GDSL hydrolase family protein n=1 Tax=Niabella agricola TaxID=2891571 RepID=UPI001F18D518|nr:SGNH/GDSL hydrolase family protein [Niabella agricola]MCF3108405.1 SGNH/GDSL hydrolase family protein [Niabella agricola]
MKKRTIALLFFFLLISGFKKQDIKWVAIGDSITYLNEHLNETGNRVAKGYLTLVTEQLPFVHYTNKGYNGWTAGRIAANFDSLYIPFADVYTVLLGTNDWWQGRPVGSVNDYKAASGEGTIYGSFRIIVSGLRKSNPNARIILITPLQRTDFVYLFNMKNNAWGSYKDKDGQSLKQVAAAVKNIAAMEGLECIDLYNDPELREKDLVRFKWLKDPATGKYRRYEFPDFQKIPFNPETDEYPYPEAAIGLTYDGLHPSDKGNRIIARRIVSLLSKQP